MALVLATSFFVAAEFALVAADRAKLQHAAAEGSRRARLALALTRRLSFHLSGAQLGVTLCSLVLGVLAEPVLAEAIHSPVAAVVGEGAARETSVVLALVLSTVGSMVLGELVPKGLVLAKPLRAAENLSGPLRAFSILATPLIAASNGAANRIVRLFGIQPREELASARSVEELALLIRSSGERGAIDRQAARLLTRSIRFVGKTADDAMTPRTRIEALPRYATVADLVAASLATGASRFPVHEGDLDSIVGVVHVKDVYRLPPAERATAKVESIASPVYAVPETRPLEELLTDLRSRGEHVAIVVDEHGGTAGMVTMEDLLEEIVGEISDEYDTPPASVTVPGPGGAVTIGGELHPDEVADAVGLQIPEGPYETFAGFVLDRLGHLPVEGESIVHDGWTITVASLDRHRIAALHVLPPVPAAAPLTATGGPGRQ